MADTYRSTAGSTPSRPEAAPFVTLDAIRTTWRGPPRAVADHDDGWRVRHAQRG